MASRASSLYPALRPIQAPTRLSIPVSPGAFLLPVGSRVFRGTRLTTGATESGHVPLSPIDGEVVAHTTARIVPDTPTSAVVIRAAQAREAAVDGEEHAAHDPSLADPAALVRWIDRIREAGIHAARVGCPDLLGQLHLLLSRPCDTVICSALDSDPDVQLNATIAATHGNEIRAAMQLLGRLTGAARRLFVAAVGESQLRAGTSLPRWRKIGARFVGVRNVYPQADPTLLLYALLRRRLRPGRLPPELGVVLIDSSVAAAIGRLALSGEPMLDTPLVVCDVTGGRTHHLRVPIGISVRQIMDSLAMQSDGASLRAGDALRHCATTPDAVVGAGELVIHVGYAEPAVNPDPCIRCGWCVQACPTRVQPAAVFEASQSHDPSRAEEFGIDACIECGICAYVCPSRLPLLDAIRDMRVRRHR